MVNKITKITINNIKGKDIMELPIDCLYANKPNILVASNGYGKTTIAIAIKAASSGKLKLNKDEQHNDSSIEITFEGEINGTLHSNLNEGNISRKINICVINDSVEAKSTGKTFGGFHTSSAEIVLKDIVLLEKIPNKNEIEKYNEYKRIKKKIDERLKIFNTLGRELTSHKSNGKLIVKFDKPSSMSNGERDVLLFITKLTAFEEMFTKKVGILVIDDIFDYLDGSNMLAVQYYISELIKDAKNKNKVLYVLIFTHLDPCDFSNYYFNDKKITYLTNMPNIQKDNVYYILMARGSDNIAENLKKYIEQYYLHYHCEKKEIIEDIDNDLLKDFNLQNLESNFIIKQQCYNEITENYLKDSLYNPLKVILGLRLKIEEIVFSKIDQEQKDKFFNIHKTINKMNLDKSKSIPELFYLLQPLYNDSLHLSDDKNKNILKIKGLKLKLENMHIKMMINKVFYE